MPAKGERPTAEHIMKILEPKKGKGCVSQIAKGLLLAQGYFHTDKAMLDNFKVLLEQGKIVKVGRYYGVPIERDDGTG